MLLFPPELLVLQSKANKQKQTDRAKIESRSNVKSINLDVTVYIETCLINIAPAAGKNDRLSSAGSSLHSELRLTRVRAPRLIPAHLIRLRRG